MTASHRSHHHLEIRYFNGGDRSSLLPSLSSKSQSHAIEATTDHRRFPFPSISFSSLRRKQHFSSRSLGYKVKARKNRKIDGKTFKKPRCLYDKERLDAELKLVGE